MKLVVRKSIYPRKPDDPTPEEIHQACLRIQKNWSEEERRYRAGIRDHWWHQIVVGSASDCGRVAGLETET
jgi:hypothetical protein